LKTDRSRRVVDQGDWPETGLWEITPGKWASILQPHWHRHLDVKRPYRGCAGGHDPEVVMIEAVVPVKAD